MIFIKTNARQSVQPSSVTSTEVSNGTFVACVAHIDLNNDGAVDRGLGQKASHPNKLDASPVGGGERCYALTGLRD